MGSVERYETPAGLRWLARWRDDMGRQRKRTFRRKLDADRYLTAVEHSLHAGSYVDPAVGRQTFAVYYADWSSRQVWTPGTSRAMSLAARSVPFADLPLSRLRRSHLEAWVKTMDATLAPGTIRTRLNNVRAVLRAAVRDRVLTADPSVGVLPPRDRRREAAMVLPTAAQVRAVLDAADPSWQALIALGAFAGLRLGEAAALKVGDVDFLSRKLQVARQVQRAGGGLVEIRPPKYGSERTVYLGDGLLKVLAGHIARLPNRDSVRWLFGVEQPPHQNTVGHQWRQACKRAKVEGVTLHDLRHYYASGLIAAGCDVVTVQRALGHAKATTTLGVYSHLWPTAEDRTRQASAAMFDEVVQDRPNGTQRAQEIRERP